KICALIPAAGSGSRMQNSVKKPYLNLGGKPILVHTIGVFDRNPVIDTISVIVDATDLEMCQSTVIAPNAFQKVGDLVVGGETRQASVFNGLQSLPTDVDCVIVHDGVRPFVTDEMIFACIEAADEWGAAVAAVPAKDTIKVASTDGFIVDTPDRDKLWAVQTPQAFRASVLLDAHAFAKRERVTATDDATLVEQLGFKVKIVSGSDSNLKITTPNDLIIAEALKRGVCA
ncbi:MAG: 2-C-methyl-D-erythritol 4-phosphate cytidylyltransferase, partial [Candidatus Poribacteria bacterium]|nr:2-C-methyl-D-erythritol 4-phosphate cytidylyltransferase [Candidatus Poribacteria bacterium]